MKRFAGWFGALALGVAVALPAAAFPATPCGTHGDRSTMLVTTSWLAAHLNDPNLVLFEVGDKSDYDSGHIPGAQFLDYMQTHLMESGGLTLELMPMPQLADLLARHGVSDDSHVVLYMGKDWASPTTRIYWTLDALGLGAHTSILDGGLPIWRAEGRAVTRDVPAPRQGKLTPCQVSDVFADADMVRAALHQPGTDIVDARAPEYFSGERTGKGLRPGHIPGAVNIPHTSVFDDSGKLKSPEALEAMFRAVGIRPGDHLLVYCHIGQFGTAIYFVARYLGYDVRLYDGSWEDWSAHIDLPTELTSGSRP